jgi:hypothetical protein
MVVGGRLRRVDARQNRPASSVRLRLVVGIGTGIGLFIASFGAQRRFVFARTQQHGFVGTT